MSKKKKKAARLTAGQPGPDVTGAPVPPRRLAYRVSDGACRAREPRSYDRMIYAGLLGVAFFATFIAVAFAVFGTVTEGEQQLWPAFDFGSFLKGSASQADPHNPCIVLQEYLESIASREHENAYGMLDSVQREELSLEDFVDGTGEYSELFTGIKSYQASSYSVVDNTASCTGYIHYEEGGRSKVEAAFSRTEDRWQLSFVSVIYD